MSNWIGVNADQTSDGHPIIVAGPQTSYFVPQLLWEAAVISTGDTDLELAARGVSTVNLPYVTLGRGLAHAWSATSAGSDLIDTRVSRMCNTDGSPPSREAASSVLMIDAATRANLELIRTLSGDFEGSLLSVIDRTKTTSGARLPACDDKADADRCDIDTHDGFARSRLRRHLRSPSAPLRRKRNWIVRPGFQGTRTSTASGRR